MAQGSMSTSYSSSSFSRSLFLVLFIGGVLVQNLNPVAAAALEDTTTCVNTVTKEDDTYNLNQNSGNSSSHTVVKNDGRSKNQHDIVDDPNNPISCQDTTKQCEYWANIGECIDNKKFMTRRCPRSCKLCADQVAVELKHGSDLGEWQELESKSFQVTEEDSIQRIVAARQYIKTLKLNEEVMSFCVNKNKSCTIWAVAGECEKNPPFMTINCSPACMTCELFTVEGRCPIDRDAIPAWKEGDLNAMFHRLTEEPYLSKYDVQILSVDPWVITMENVVSREEAERIIELGHLRGYERSKDVGSKQPDGSYGEIVTDYRTSHNSWCQKGCRDDETVMAVTSRLSNLTDLPAINSEDLQVLRYEVGQYYKSHHDYIAHNIDRQQGVRILTVFLYLNDVEEGGGTHFNRLNITVQPKQGRALLWPSVLNGSPHAQDPRTFHEALPVVKGVKYGANAWFHQFDFQTPSNKGCIL